MKCQGFLLFVAAVAGLQLASAQDVTDCTDISVGLETTPITPVTVPDLPICEAQRTVAQCCSTEYVQDRLNITAEDFLEGLRLELQQRFENFENIVDQLRAFVSGNLLPTYFASIGNLRSVLGGGNGLISRILAQLRANLDFNPGDDDDDDNGMEVSQNFTNGFNVRGLLNNLLSGVATAVGDRFSRGPNSATSQCIRRVIENQVQQRNLNIQAASLQQIRRVMAAVENIRDFVRNLTDNLAGFRPLQQCIDTVVRLNTCGRCTAVRPPFCQNVCAAIANACYSPFNDALEDQLEQLWEVVRRIFTAANNAIVDLNNNKGLLNATTMTSQISADCQVSIAIARSGRQSDDDDDEDDIDIPGIPGLLTAAAEALNGGPFDYEDRPIQAPGICRLLNTSSMNCWNGSMVVAQDIAEFDDDDIIDQVNNPVITIPQQTLVNQANSLGTPVTMALNSPSFSQIAPEGLVIPDAGGPVAPGNNGAATMFLTITSLPLMLLASFLAL